MARNTLTTAQRVAVWKWFEVNGCLHADWSSLLAEVEAGTGIDRLTVANIRGIMNDLGLSIAPPKPVDPAVQVNADLATLAKVVAALIHESGCAEVYAADVKAIFERRSA